MKGRMTVLSCGIGNFPARERLWEILLTADIAAGSARLLEQIGEFQGERILLDKYAAAQMRFLVDAARKGKQIVVLASGDALFHGIGATIRRLAAEDIALCFIPAPTAFQELFARLGMPWDAAQFFSVHHTDPVPCREILAARLAVVYGGKRISAAGAASALISAFPGAAGRPAVLAEQLGTIEERIRHGSLAELAGETAAPLAVLLVLPPETACQMPCFPLGLPEDFYAHSAGLITAPEVRAVILAKLQLPADGVLWDIGAGSGSVGLEAAALRPRLMVYALEKSLERIGNIQTNAARLGVVNVRVQQGTAPDALAKLPAPARVFLGGGGGKLPEILDVCYAALPPGGLIVVSAVTLETSGQLFGWQPQHRLGSLTLDIAVEQALAGKYHYLKNKNRITLVIFGKQV